MSTSHGRFQEAFAAALFSPPATLNPEMARLAAQPAFAVYRNTVMKVCVDALEANFPAVARLVGAEWFHAMASIYVVADAPRDARLLCYGNSFADFLRVFEPAAELVYLPGVARLDTFWREAHGAPDVPAIDAAWVARHEPDQIAAWALGPHPAARWAWFDEQPIYSIWARNRRPDDLAEELTWKGEGALLTRPRDTVRWQEISKDCCVFLDACAAGADLSEAMERVLVANSDAELASTFSTLLRAGAFAGTPESLTSKEPTP